VRRIGLVLSAAAVVAALGVALAPGRGEPVLPALASPAPPRELYAIDFAVDGGRLVRLDPRTLEAQPGSSARVFDHLAGWSFSRDRRRLALGSQTGSLLILDTVRMRTAARVDTGVGGSVLATHWVGGRRLLAVVDRTVVAVDPARGRVLARTPLPGWPVRAAGTAQGLVLLLGPAAGVGDSTVAVVAADGDLRAVALLPGILSGVEEIDHERPGLFRQAIPALALDEAGRRAFVVAAGAPVAEIDLVTLRVELHELSRPVSALGRLRDWLEPVAEAKGAAVGPRRSARWLGDGVLAVWGTDDEGAIDPHGLPQQRQEPAGLALVDTRRWTVRTLDPGASQAAVADGLLLASAALWDSAAQRARGMGLVAYGPGGARRFHVLDSAPAWEVEVVGARAFVTQPGERGRTSYAVVDLRAGRVTATLRPRTSFVLLNGGAAPALG
jgi:hypothetical protein